jgi:predicted DNA-binding transcriptional regulator YafY
MTKVSKRISQLERLDDLIRRKATGTPTELAVKMALSERTVYHFIEELREHGACIVYNKFRESYEYTEAFEFPYKKGN